LGQWLPPAEAAQRTDRNFHSGDETWPKIRIPRKPYLVGKATVQRPKIRMILRKPNLAAKAMVQRPKIRMIVRKPYLVAKTMVQWYEHESE
jgi:hypothetical protein